MSLDKKCVQKVFPEVISEEDRCENVDFCRGYNKFCPNYVPFSSIDLRKCEEYMDFKDNVENSAQ